MVVNIPLFYCFPNFIRILITTLKNFLVIPGLQVGKHYLASASYTSICMVQDKHFKTLRLLDSPQLLLCTCSHILMRKKGGSSEPRQKIEIKSNTILGLLTQHRDAKTAWISDFENHQIDISQGQPKCSMPESNE